MKLRSVTVLKVAVILCMTAVVALAVGAPWIVRWYTAVRTISPAGGRALLFSYYLCAVPAMIALYCMLRLLQQIRNKHPFAQSAPTYLNIISWCCLAVSAICFVGGFWYQPIFLVFAAMLFLFLVVRVMSSCFVAGAQLQEDNDLTV